MDEDKVSILKVSLDFIRESTIARLFQLTIWAFVSYFLYLIVTDITRAEAIYQVAFNRPTVLEKKLFIPDGESSILMPIICADIYCVPFKKNTTEEINRLLIEEEQKRLEQQ